MHRQPSKQQGQPQPQEAAPAGGEKPRFGINSLINRMTGHNGPDTQARPQAQPPVQSQPQAGVERRQPQMHAAPRMDEHDEQMEIPAFLRRQAN
ncbi:MAG TPA: hypothetical protein ENK83_07130 [Aliiroseovarius sp.]|nr:hypothetical protein [Aliiroseovarius sp.]